MEVLTARTIKNTEERFLCLQQFLLSLFLVSYSTLLVVIADLSTCFSRSSTNFWRLFLLSTYIGGQNVHVKHKLWLSPLLASWVFTANVKCQKKIEPQFQLIFSKFFNFTTIFESSESQQNEIERQANSEATTDRIKFFSTAVAWLKSCRKMAFLLAQICHTLPQVLWLQQVLHEEVLNWSYIQFLNTLLGLNSPWPTREATCTGFNPG